MTIEEKLAYFMNISVEETTKEANAMISEYSAELDRQYEEHKAQVELQEAKELAAESEDIRREGNKRLAQEHLVNKRAVSQKNAQLKEKLAAEVEQLVDEYRRSERYTEVIRNQIVQAKEFARRDDIIIYIDPADTAMKRKLEEETGCFLTVSQYSFGGGMRAVIPARNILIDNSIDSRKAEVMEDFQFDGGYLNGR